MPEWPMADPLAKPPETVLDVEPAEARRGLALALAVEDLDARRVAISRTVAQWPRMLDAWAALGEVGRDPIESYAAFRVGYHRGLDRLRAQGWRGSGYVRWRNEENRGFLRCLAGLADAANRIGEADEVARIEQFLTQLDPMWPPESVER